MGMDTSPIAIALLSIACVTGNRADKYRNVSLSSLRCVSLNHSEIPQIVNQRWLTLVMNQSSGDIDDNNADLLKLCRFTVDLQNAINQNMIHSNLSNVTLGFDESLAMHKVICDEKKTEHNHSNHSKGDDSSTTDNDHEQHQYPVVDGVVIFALVFVATWYVICHCFPYLNLDLSTTGNPCYLSVLCRLSMLGCVWCCHRHFDERRVPLMDDDGSESYEGPDDEESYKGPRGDTPYWQVEDKSTMYNKYFGVPADE